MNRILDVITQPNDLRFLTNEELSLLALEVREEIVQTCSENGGHLAPSLGTVELILSAYACIDSPKDRIIFDVGHQSYAHKLITNRLDLFKTLRTYGGISGFTKPCESPYDVHVSGHASDSLSVALGLAKARDLNGGDEKIIAVIGDASLSGGMALEALNCIGEEQTQIIIILNDNNMSISRNVGALVRHLGYMRTSNQYIRTREVAQEKLEGIGSFGRAITRYGKAFKESLKQVIIPDTMMFEKLGIVCSAPIDGHNIPLMKETISSVLSAQGPVLIHAVTKKGAGYAPAEANPTKFHGIAPFNVEDGELKASGCSAKTYTSVFGEAIVREAANNKDVVAITAAMSDGTGLEHFSRSFPDRFFDVGIAEEHAVGFAAGLASKGKRPVVAIYSTFIQRAIDQMIIDVALPKLPVVFALDRAGLVGEDGPTHHGVFDLVFARMMPGLCVMAPSNEDELSNALHTALLQDFPVCIRYPRGKGPGVDVSQCAQVLEVGKSKCLRKGSDLAILAFGSMVNRALEAAVMLEKDGIGARVVDMRWVKPLDISEIKKCAKLGLVVTVEEGVIAGGVGQEVQGHVIKANDKCKFLNLGIGDEFITHGSCDKLLSEIGLNSKGIYTTIRNYI